MSISPRGAFVKPFATYKLFSFVFSSGSHTAPYVAFLFVLFKNELYLFIQLRIIVFEPLGHILMYGCYKYERFRQGLTLGIA